MPHHHHPHPHDRASAAAVAQALDAERLERILWPWLPDPRERSFVVRCILGEGPIHHRVASYALIALAGLIAERLRVAPTAPVAMGVKVPMRLSPGQERPYGETPAYPLPLDDIGLAAVTRGRHDLQDALTSAVIDGPPHHALANVALLNLLGAILAHIESSA